LSPNQGPRRCYVGNLRWAGFPDKMMPLNFIADSLRLTSALGGKNLVCRAQPRLPKFITGFETIVTYRGLRFRIHIGEEIGRRMFYYNQYEHLQENVFLDLIGGNAGVFDIGANMGLFFALWPHPEAHRSFLSSRHDWSQASFRKMLSLTGWRTSA
jgi:hypothetical protein